jgi:branched-chain amino acid transport system substrate-binding protein
MLRSSVARLAGRSPTDRGSRFLLLTVALLVAVAACGGSSKDSSSSDKAQKTYRIGVLTDISGPSSALGKSVLGAVKAGIGVAGTEGYKLDYVTGDTQSTAAGAAVAAQKLVTQDHVFAVILISNLGYGAAPFLAAHKVPVFGADIDGAEWLTDSNMFSVFGYPDYTKVETTIGQFFKLVGATTIGAIAYQVVPSAALSAAATAVSVPTAGLKMGYLNAKVPLGSTDVGPMVLAMKSAKVDGAIFLLQQNTAFAVMEGLAQQGAALKAPLLTGGYGGDLFNAGPGALQAAQGAYFELPYVPVEMNTPATRRMQAALKQYGQVTEAPGLNEYTAYMSVDAIVAGLKKVGANPTQASLITATLGISDYDGAGLYGGHTLNFGLAQRGKGGTGASNCAWFTKFEGNAFHPVQGATPLCGSVIPGKTVSS